jgi:hypothetical protein
MQWQNVKGCLEISRSMQHVFKENHHILWKEAKMLYRQREMNSMYRKYEEAACMSCLKNPISQPSTAILPIWYSSIRKELSK